MKICRITLGAATMLETKEVLVETLSSSEAVIFCIKTEGHPITSVPRDLSLAAVLICQIDTRATMQQLMPCSMNLY